MLRGSGRTIHFARILSVLAAAIATAGCLKNNSSHANRHAIQNKVRIALILDRGGKNDNSFNEAAYRGAMKAKRDLGIHLKYVEAPNVLAYESMQRALAQRHFALIIAIGFGQADGLKHVAKKYPKQHFAIVDSEVDLPNVKSILFEEHEGSYLVGALAARMSKTHTIGFIGGMDIPLIRRFQMGYIAGAHKFSKKTKIISEYIGMTSEAWTNPSRAKEIALSLYSKGADIIFAAAGSSGIGVFDAAAETHHFAIGVDSDQDWMKPGYILTSLVKHVDRAVYSAIEQQKNGKFKGGVEHWGLKNGGIDFALDKYNKNLIDKKTIAYLDRLKSEIIAGKIVVPDYYKLSHK